MKSKDYKIEIINQQDDRYRMEIIKNVVNMIETAHYFIFITAKTCVIRRRRDIWRWAE